MSEQITQEITQLPEAPKEGGGFRARAASFLSVLVTMAGQLATWTAQANAMAAAINADAVTAATSASHAEEDAAVVSAAVVVATEKAGIATAAASEAVGAAGDAAVAKNQAGAARDEALAAAAGVNLPPVTVANAGQVLGVGPGGTSAWMWPWGGGECQLRLSGGNLLLSRYNGWRLVIDNVVQSIPEIGVLLAPTGLIALSLYYIYAYMLAGLMTLEASTTAPAIDPRNGFMVKTGDTSRALVGMARPGAGPGWIDSVAQRLVVSWFNRRPLQMRAINTGTLSTASPTPVELSTALRVEYLAWGDDPIDFTIQAINTAVAGINISLGTILTGAPMYVTFATSMGATTGVPNSLRHCGAVPAGYGWLSPAGYVGSGTGSYVNTTISGVVRG